MFRARVSALLALALSLTGCPRTTGTPRDAGFDAPYDPTVGNRFQGPISLDDQRVAAIDPLSLSAGATPCRAPLLARVYQVTDGDTVSVLGVEEVVDLRIRLIGVDTPEIAHDATPAECFGDEAAAFTSQLQGRVVWLTFDNSCLDPFGRTLAYVFVGGGAGDFWQRQLLRRGLARQFTDSSDRTFASLFAEDLSTAQAAPTGLWAVCP
ncbi:MAG: thermonuclease family protein [Sandaracinaceae bacterium]|nr:thermonuclease family protein [Sandaracinaceae bacterium]